MTVIPALTAAETTHVIRQLRVSSFRAFILRLSGPHMFRAPQRWRGRKHHADRYLSVIKSILVPSTGGHGDQAPFDAALQIARLSDAHIDFLHLRADPRILASSLTPSYAGMDCGLGICLDSVLENAARVADQSEQEAQAGFDTFRFHTGAPLSGATSSRSCTAGWRNEAGEVAASMVCRTTVRPTSLCSDVQDATLRLVMT